MTSQSVVSLLTKVTLNPCKTVSVEAEHNIRAQWPADPTTLACTVPIREPRLPTRLELRGALVALQGARGPPTYFPVLSVCGVRTNDDPALRPRILCVFGAAVTMLVMPKHVCSAVVFLPFDFP